ncbi:MAG: DUF6544 family protein [Betaproteobacteria bacterium]
MTLLLWAVLVACLVAAAGVALSALGAHRWAVAMGALASKLEAAPGTPRAPFGFDELAGLPAPAQRYFRAVLKPGQTIVAAATIELAGTINMSATGEQWKPFTSRQRAVMRRPGFLWDARVSMLPAVPVRVVDAYIAGEGLLRAAVLGLFTVADVRGGGEIARGEFMRYVAEAAWYPTALLPSQGVRWAPVDDRSAKATFVDGPLSLTLLFRFDEAGLITSVLAEARAARVGKGEVMLPWEGCWSNYQWRGGMLVPLTGEVAWLRPEGRKRYFVGTVQALTHEYAP